MVTTGQTNTLLSLMAVPLTLCDLAAPRNRAEPRARKHHPPRVMYLFFAPA